MGSDPRVCTAVAAINPHLSRPVTYSGDGLSLDHKGSKNIKKPRLRKFPYIELAERVLDHAYEGLRKSAGTGRLYYR